MLTEHMSIQDQDRLLRPIDFFVYQLSADVRRAFVRLNVSLLHLHKNTDANVIVRELINFLCFRYKRKTRFGTNERKNGKVFDGQEPPSGESTTTECGFNYQLLAVIY